jgi:hypothetical protein
MSKWSILRKKLFSKDDQLIPSSIQKRKAPTRRESSVVSTTSVTKFKTKKAGNT